MITNIPPASDFEDSGLSLLNFAWDTVISLLIKMDDAKEWGIDVNEVEDDYWQASKQHLLTGVSVAQQGIEFIIKGCITEVSPYLLIAGVPKDWPKNCHKEDISFAEFRTIDAQDLIKVYNSCASNRLNDEFIGKFDDLRKKRNSIMHTIDKRINFHALEIIVEILSVHKLLFPEEKWINIRRRFIEESPLSALNAAEHSEYRVIWEFSMLANMLKPADTKKYFNFNKKQRRYICPICDSETSDSALEPRTALLSPNSSHSKNVYCFVCNYDTSVTRTDCEKLNCKGNVISDEYGICLTCGNHHD